MKLCNLHDWLMVSLSAYHGELATVHGKINGMESLYTKSVLKCGVW